MLSIGRESLRIRLATSVLESPRAGALNHERDDGGTRDQIVYALKQAELGVPVFFGVPPRFPPPRRHLVPQATSSSVGRFLRDSISP